LAEESGKIVNDGIGPNDFMELHDFDFPDSMSLERLLVRIFLLAFHQLGMFSRAVL
jgi:hypothetical protein